MATDSDESLRQATTRGFVWTGGQAFVERALSLVGFIVLARLLSPTQYGVVALANVFATLLATVAAGGYSQVLVQRPKIDKEDVDTVFWIGLATGTAFAVILALAAWPLASAFGQPELRPVLQVLSISLVLVAVGSVPQGLLQRALRFRDIATMTIAANIVATLLGVAFAVLGFGVWALVIQTVVAIGVLAVGLFVRSGYRPSAYVSIQRFLPLFEFSRNYVGSSLMFFLNQRTDDFLIGSVLGSRSLGIYTIAYRGLTVMIEVLAVPIRRVAFPVFARLQDDRERLLRAYAAAIRLCAAVAIPCYAFTIAAAPEIIRVVFGAKWDASAPVLQILCLFGIQEAIVTFNDALLQGIGRAKFVFRITLAGTVLQVAAFAVSVRYGIEWVAAAFVIRAYLVAPVGLIATARALDTSLRRILSGALPPALSAAAMALAVTGTRAAIGSGPHEGARLLVLVSIGALVYPLTLRLIRPSAFREVVDYAVTAFSRPAPEAGASTQGVA